MTDALFTDADLFGYDQVDVFEAVKEQLAEDAIEAERVAAADAEAIAAARGFLTADLPAGAAQRITATLGTDQANAPVATPRGYIPNVVANTGGKVHMGTTHDTPVPFCRKSADAGRYRNVDDEPVTCKRCAEIAKSPLFLGRVNVEPEPALELDAPPVDVDALELSPRMRAMILDIDAGPWHYQTRHKAHAKGLVTDIKATSLTEFGKRVRTALQAQ
ncbi:hypothetical protein [Nocardiopsis alba]|uniref:hypothetical protein n=1 Tax=Nocardiopsis alba TaxID=53437 RepID=UPI0035D989F6